MNGDLELSPEGMATEKQLMDALERSGMRDKTLAKTLSSAAKDGPINIFEMDGGSGEHSASSGIRDPKPDGAKFDEAWGSFAEGDRFTLSSLESTVKYVRAHPNDVNKTAKLPLGIDLLAVSASVAVLEAWGTPSESGEKYMLVKDLRALFLEGRYPPGWKPGGYSLATLGGTLLKSFGWLMCSFVWTPISSAAPDARAGE